MYVPHCEFVYTATNDSLVLELTCVYGLGGQPRQESLWKLEVAGLALTRRNKGSGSNKGKLKRYFLTRLHLD